MTTSIRFLPLLVIMLGSAACGDDQPSVTFADAGGVDDTTPTDDAATTNDAATSADGSDGATEVDAPTGTDAPRPDSPTGSDVGNRTDGSTGIDVAGEAGDARGTDTAMDAGTAPCVGTIDTEFLREKLSKLDGELPVQIGGMDVSITERKSAAYKAYARQFLTSEYQALGFTVTEQTYASGVNLVATKTGADTKFVVLSAHYDTIQTTVPGADDDGSGVIGALATAKALQGCQLDHGLRVLAFDEEETGLVGSKAYVSQLQSSGELADLIGDVQLEMLGYHTKQDGGFLLVDCKSAAGDRPESAFLKDTVLAAMTRGGLPLEPHSACVGSSDHGAFWSASKPAIVFSEEFSFSGANSNPCYHKACDTISFINFDYFTTLTTLGVLVTADLAGAH